MAEEDDALEDALEAAAAGGDGEELDPLAEEMLKMMEEEGGDGDTDGGDSDTEEVAFLLARRPLLDGIEGSGHSHCGQHMRIGLN